MSNNLQKFRDFKYSFCPVTPIRPGESKIEGWQSDSFVFKDVIDKYKPMTIVEIGSWLGASALHMSSLCEAHIICVDTYLGSNADLWREHKTKDLINNFSQIYNQFCINITSHFKNDYISPLPMTSSSAAELFRDCDITADLIYIDAGHQYKEVYDDLEAWFPLADKVLIGDDYSPRWLGVIQAVKTFTLEHNLAYDVSDSKFIIAK